MGTREAHAARTLSMMDGCEPFLFYLARDARKRMNVMFKRNGWYFQADGAGAAGDPLVETAPEPVTEDFDTWLEKQPEEVKKKFSEKYGKLSETLEKERKANKEYAKSLKRLTELEEAEEKRKAEALTQEQKLQGLVEAERKQREAAEQTLKQERIRNAVYLEATKPQFGERKSRFIDPAEAELFMAQYGEVEIDEDGKVNGVVEALHKLAKAKAHLLEQPAALKSGTPVVGKKVNTAEIQATYPIPRL